MPNFLKALTVFHRPRRAVFAMCATIFVLVMLGVGQYTDGTVAGLIQEFAGVLALLVGSGFLVSGAKTMRLNHSNLGLLMGVLGLLILGFGVVQIIAVGAGDFAKEFAALVGGGILGFFDDEG